MVDRTPTHRMSPHRTLQHPSFAQRASTRRFVLAALGGAAALAVGLPARSQPGMPRVQVYKTPTCGCCGAWVEHLQAAGFAVTVHEVEDTAPVRSKHGLPERYGSCHTALVEGYVVEGHVPAQDIRRLLAARPVALGLAVPGMPVGSPGMEMGARKDPYDVLLIDKQGRSRVYARHG